MGREALISTFPLAALPHWLSPSFCFPFAFADDLFASTRSSACQRNWAVGWQHLLLSAVLQQG
jgi:hypothetical protein